MGYVSFREGNQSGQISFIATKHTGPFSPQKVAYKKGKWDPGYFREIDRLVKYYSIWPDQWI